LLKKPRMFLKRLTVWNKQ